MCALPSRDRVIVLTHRLQSTYVADSRGSEGARESERESEREGQLGMRSSSSSFIPDRDEGLAPETVTNGTRSSSSPPSSLLERFRLAYRTAHGSEYRWVGWSGSLVIAGRKDSAVFFVFHKTRKTRLASRGSHVARVDRVQSGVSLRSGGMLVTGCPRRAARFGRAERERE